MKRKKMETINALFKKHLNNPNYLVRQEDKLASLFMNGERDLEDFMKHLGIFQYDKDITYRELLLKLHIPIL